MTRTNAREIAVHLVYAMEYTDELPEELLLIRFEEEYYSRLAEETAVYAKKPDEDALLYIENIVRGVYVLQKDLDAVIERYSIGWRLSRISRLAKAIMRVCIYEIGHVEDVTTAEAINEAVELTRRYEDEETVSFVNGILGSYVRGEML